MSDCWVIDPDEDPYTLPAIPPSDHPCLESSGGAGAGYWCSRSKGHSGSHAASGLYGTYAVWR